MIDRITIAAALYTAYCESVGGKAFNGDPLPDWETFFYDPTKAKQANAWLAAADKAIELLEEEEIPPHQQRVIEEQKELQTKLDALATFTDESPIFKGLSQVERQELLEQEWTMDKYNSILKSRIERFQQPQHLGDGA